MRCELESNQSQSQIVFKLRTGLELVEARNLELIQIGPVTNDPVNIQRQLDFYKKYRKNLNSTHRNIKETLQMCQQYLENPQYESVGTEAIRRNCKVLSDNWIRLLSHVALWNKDLRQRAVKFSTMDQYPARTQQDQRATWREQLDFTAKCINRLNREATSVPQLSPANRKCVQELNLLVNKLKLDVERELAGVQVEHDIDLEGGWKRAEIGGMFYYIDATTKSTQWDHPLMSTLISQLSEFNNVRFAAYRTALKLRSVQKDLKLHLIPLARLIAVLNPLNIGDNSADRSLSGSDMISVLASIYNQETNVNLHTHLALNYLTNSFDVERGGNIPNISFQVGLVLLSMGSLDDKFKYLFTLIMDTNGRVESSRLGLLLGECVKVPIQLDEASVFDVSNVENSVRSCFERANNPTTINASEFLSWLRLGPQSLVWLHVLQRITAGESVVHPQRCDVCKRIPIQGLRFRCLRCFNFNLCQICFLSGKQSRRHRITHPIHEYYWEATSCENRRDFVRTLKNRFKSKRSLAKVIASGYLHVPRDGRILEDIREELPTQDMEVEDHRFSPGLHPEPLLPVITTMDEEHNLIAEYCQSLNNSSPFEPEASSQHQFQLESLLRSVEQENAALELEYEYLCTAPDIDNTTRNVISEARRTRQHKRRLWERMILLQNHKAELEMQIQKLGGLIRN